LFCCSADYWQLRTELGPAENSDGIVVHYGIATHHVGRSAHIEQLLTVSAAQPPRHCHQPGSSWCPGQAHIKGLPSTHATAAATAATATIVQLLNCCICWHL